MSMNSPSAARRALAAAAILVTTCTALTLSPHTASAARIAASTGCSGSTAWAPGSDISGSLSSGGQQRSYLLHIPQGYTPTTPQPLILNLPGSGMTPQNEEQVTGLSGVADAQHMIIVYPQGTGSPLGWDTYPTNSAQWQTSPYSRTDDVAFLTTLVSTLEGRLCIDTTRIAATGYSLGAVMSYHLACSSVPWIGVVASVAGTMSTWQSGCTLAHPTALIAFHGERDPIVYYSGIGPYLLSIPTVVANWASAAGCAQPGQTLPQVGDVVETVYSTCTNGADTQLYSVTDGGHTWPGGMALPALGVTTTTINASSLIADFLAAHPLSQ